MPFLPVDQGNLEERLSHTEKGGVTNVEYSQEGRPEVIAGKSNGLRVRYADGFRRCRSGRRRTQLRAVRALAGVHLRVLAGRTALGLWVTTVPENRRYGVLGGGGVGPERVHDRRRRRREVADYDILAPQEARGALRVSGTLTLSEFHRGRERPHPSTPACAAGLAETGRNA